jgi:membrane fusion protein (multidrug efflux system)
MDDIFVVNGGLALNEKIVLEGVRQTHEGELVEESYRKPEEVLASMKKHAE